MALVKYEGRLGVFEYDDTIFSIADKEHSSLIYIGNETDGSKIKIPDGVVDLTNTFCSSYIESPPAIPNSVKIMKSTFMNTDINRVPMLPPNVEVLDFAFAMTNVVFAPPLPKHVVSAEGIFQDCPHFRGTLAIRYSLSEYCGCAVRRKFREGIMRA